jgi:putative membrane protein
MFHDGYTMVGMHAGWWLLWAVLIGVALFAAWGRAGRQGSRPRETPHEVLRRRLAAGEITPPQYEERKALLDRDIATPT